MPGVEAFAYDLVVARGPVSGRVALLLRSTEGKPSCALAFFERNLPVRCYGWRAAARAVATHIGGPDGVAGLGGVGFWRRSLAEAL
jgi:hypothetical protein